MARYRSDRSYRRDASLRGQPYAALTARLTDSPTNMASPSELSLEEIRNYLLENGGTARNHDLVKHFKRFLTDPETRGGLNVREAQARPRHRERVSSCMTCNASRCKHTGGLLARSWLRTEFSARCTFSRYSRGQESVQGVCQHPGHHKERRGRLRALAIPFRLSTGATCCSRDATLPAWRSARDQFKISNARLVLLCVCRFRHYDGDFV